MDNNDLVLLSRKKKFFSYIAEFHNYYDIISLSNDDYIELSSTDSNEYGFEIKDTILIALRDLPDNTDDLTDFLKNYKKIYEDVFGKFDSHYDDKNDEIRCKFFHYLSSDFTLDLQGNNEAIIKDLLVVYGDDNE